MLLQFSQFPPLYPPEEGDFWTKTTMKMVREGAFWRKQRKLQVETWGGDGGGRGMRNSRKPSRLKRSEEEESVRKMGWAEGSGFDPARVAALLTSLPPWWNLREIPSVVAGHGLVWVNVFVSWGLRINCPNTFKHVKSRQLNGSNDDVFSTLEESRPVDHE